MRPFVEQHQQQIQTMLTALDHSRTCYSYYYIHHGADLARYIFDTMAVETTGNILIFHHDHFDDENNQIIYHTIRDNLNKLSNKKIIIVTSLINLTFELNHVKTIHWGGDILFQEQQYKQLAPQQTKNFNSSTHWISLSRNARIHRILAVIYVLGKALYHYGNIRCSFNYPEVHDWPGLLRLITYSNDMIYNSNFYTKYDTVMSRGFSRLRSNQLLFNNQEDPYTGNNIGTNNNAGNFEHHLKKYYENSVVELVNETLFFQSHSLITEKFLNSVYGFNLPIILSGAGTVEHLRNIGFDLFDDVIDHAYDLVQDPLLRIQTAIDSNQRLFMDPEYARQCWKDNISRLEQNYTFAQTQMYNVYRTRCLSEFNSVFPQHFNPTLNQ